MIGLLLDMCIRICDEWMFLNDGLVSAACVSVDNPCGMCMIGVT